MDVCLFAFDLLFLNGASLVREPFRVRREKLHEFFPQVSAPHSVPGPSSKG